MKIMVLFKMLSDLSCNKTPKPNQIDDDAERINVTKPLWDQGSYWGRFKHFAFITDPRTLLACNEDLEDAKQLLEDYK